ncbi:hypothetical protein CF106_16950 [Aeromonas veronii]|nr:hypothetical protein CF106_16950 [Aeromonas veronii]
MRRSQSNRLIERLRLTWLDELFRINVRMTKYELMELRLATGSSKPPAASSGHDEGGYSIFMKRLKMIPKEIATSVNNTRFKACVR